MSDCLVPPISNYVGLLVTSLSRLTDCRSAAELRREDSLVTQSAIVCLSA